MIEITGIPLIDGIIDGITIFPRFIFDIIGRGGSYDVGFWIGVVMAASIIVGIFLWIIGVDNKDVE